MSKKKIRWNSERILSLSAMSISIITLFIFIYQTNLMSRQNDLSILPYLQLSTADNGDDGSYAMSLKNHGVGPAIIESTKLIYKGKTYDLRDYDFSFHKLMSSLLPELDTIKYTNTATLDRGIAIPAGTTYNFIQIRNSPDHYQLFLSGLNGLIEKGLQYEIVYKSIQEEKWVIHDNSEGPERID